MVAEAPPPPEPPRAEPPRQPDPAPPIANTTPIEPAPVEPPPASPDQATVSAPENQEGGSIFSNRWFIGGAALGILGLLLVPTLLKSRTRF